MTDYCDELSEALGEGGKFSALGPEARWERLLSLVEDGQQPDDWLTGMSEGLADDVLDRRPLDLTWGENERDGEVHTEWHEVCGCAVHPEPTMHVHLCEKHEKEAKDAEVALE